MNKTPENPAGINWKERYLEHLEAVRKLTDAFHGVTQDVLELCLCSAPISWEIIRKSPSELRLVDVNGNDHYQCPQCGRLWPAGGWEPINEMDQKKEAPPTQV